MNPVPFVTLWLHMVCERGSAVGCQARLIMACIEMPHVLADKRFGVFVTKQPAQRPVRKPYGAFLRDIDALRRGLHQGAIAGFAVRKRLLDLPALSDLLDQFAVASIGEPGARQRHKKEEEGGLINLPGFQRARVLNNPLIQIKRNGKERCE